MKLVWRHGERATGKYKSFQKRAWPTAYYGTADGPIAAILYSLSGVGYSTNDSETETLVIRFADYRKTDGGWDWKQLTARPVGITQAKRITHRWLDEHSEVRHEEYR